MMHGPNTHGTINIDLQQHSAMLYTTRLATAVKWLAFISLANPNFSVFLVAA